MKFRKGFVSNSSSSNFVIGNKYKNVFDLAKDMLTIRNNDYKEMSSSDHTYQTEIDNINKAILHGRDPDSSIYFATCNYDTFIKKVEGYYIVTTCNNHPFITKLKGVVLCPEIIRDWLKAKGYYSDYDGPLPFTEEIETWDFQSGEVFWDAEYDLEVSRYNYIKAQHQGKKDVIAYCKDGDHFADMMVLASSGKIICPVCYSRERDNDEPPIDSRFEILDL